MYHPLCGRHHDLFDLSKEEERSKTWELTDLKTPLCNDARNKNCLPGRRLVPCWSLLPLTFSRTWLCVSACVCQFSYAWKVNLLGQGLGVFFVFYRVFGGPTLLGTKVEIINYIRIGTSDSNNKIILKLHTNASAFEWYPVSNRLACDIKKEKRKSFMTVFYILRCYLTPQCTFLLCSGSDASSRTGSALLLLPGAFWPS